ncbi:MAG: PadR family transcriptional regulator [bacterium]|nr:PadR family transcriptional regulator [bacterium]MCP5069953.1 PadR family transcriptional regulator [bacterium]
MSLRHAILGIVEHKPIHGYGLKRVLDEGISSFWPVNLAAIYPNLHRLEEEGLLTHHMEPSSEGRPDRKVYEISEAGRVELAAWRRLPPESDDSTRVPLFLKLLFAKAENMRDSLDWIDKSIEKRRGDADLLRSALHDPKTFDSFFVRFMRESGLAHAELQVELLQDLRARVASQIEEQECSQEN